MDGGRGIDRGHQTLMDGIYRRQRLIYDATRKYFLFGRDHLIARLDPPEGGHILEMACGTGRNLFNIGKRYPGTYLYGFDISSEMLITARQSMEKRGLSDRTTLAEGDACAVDAMGMFGREEFDRVVLSYSVSMIPDWQTALSEAVRLLAPGGSLHVVDFGGQDRLPGAFRGILRAWLAKFHVSPRLDLEETMARIAEDAGATLTFESLRGDYARYGVIRR